MNAPTAVHPVLKLVTDVSAAGAGTLPMGAHSTAAHNKHPDRSGKHQGSSPAAPSGAQGHLKRSIIYNFYGTAAPMSNGEAAENMRIAFQARRFKLKSGKKPRPNCFPFRGGRVSPVLSHMVSERLLFISGAGRAQISSCCRAGARRVTRCSNTGCSGGLRV